MTDKNRNQTITLLHLSDMQFGAHHRFGVKTDTPDAALDTLSARLLQDLDSLRQEHGLKPDILLLTGDLTEQGQKTEFEDFYRFADSLTSALELPRRQVVIVPGNHDVHWRKCRHYFENCEDDGEEPRPPYWEKWFFYKRFFDLFYRDEPGIQFTKDEPWSCFEIESLKIVVAGLNSTMQESHSDHYGWTGEQQQRWFKNKLENYRQQGWLRIAAIHHNVQRGAENDNENLRDADDLERILGDSVNLLLHGHTHRGKLGWWNPGLPLLAAGSTALKKDIRPGDYPNQYQLVQIYPDKLLRWCRAFIPEQKTWKADNRVHETEPCQETPVSFAKVQAALPAEQPKMPGDIIHAGFRAPVSMHSDHDTFLARVEEVCHLHNPDAEITRLGEHTDTPYLRVCAKEGKIVRTYPLGMADQGITPKMLKRFSRQVAEKYRSGDPLLISYLVYNGERAPEELIHSAAQQRIRLQSFIEYQGLIDFRHYLERQTEKLQDDPVYPPDLYVPQQLRWQLGQDAPVEGKALPLLQKWLAEPKGRFVLVLGDFGTGKTFLLHELARTLGEAQHPGLIPILLEMRTLEKTNSLDRLAAQQLAGDENLSFTPKKFRYMLEQGRIALLFDGFDELAQRVTYTRAAEHLDTLLEAAQGEQARVIVTSRTQHFLSDKQVKQKLLENVETLARHRIVHLQAFSPAQIQIYLENRLKDKKAAAARCQLLDEIKDLLGLSENPRMLSFIADLPEQDLREAKARGGVITAAKLYKLILDRWLNFEQDRADSGHKDQLALQHRWQAVTELALLLWGKTERFVSLDELTGTLQDALNTLQDFHVAIQQIGSSTLLVRDEEGLFGFIHQSVLEWLVAEAASGRETERDAPEEAAVRSDLLAHRPLSALMTDFFCDLTGRDQALAWAREALEQTDGEILKRNAKRVLERLGEKVLIRFSFAGQDLAGEDFSGRDDLRGADFSGADLSQAKFAGAQLQDTDFSDALLEEADFKEAQLQQASFLDADCNRASFLGANLDRADLRGADFSYAALIGVQFFSDQQLMQILPNCAFGVALPTPKATTLPDTLRAFIPFPSGPVLAVAFSPDGRLIAASSEDDTLIRIWESRSGKLLRFLGTHQNCIQCLAFSPDGTRIASGSRDNTIKIWEPRSDKLLHSLEGHQGIICSIAFSPDGTRIASGSDDNTVRIWDPRSGKSLRSLAGHKATIWSVAFSPDGARIASGSDDNTVRIWEQYSGKSLYSLEGHKATIWSVAFSPDGALIASGSSDKTVKIWDSRSGKSLRSLEGDQDIVCCVTFSPDGACIASGSLDKTIRIWEPRSGKSLRSLEGHESSVLSVAFSPDGARIASGSRDNTVKIWNPHSGKSLRSLEGHQFSVLSVAFSPDGTRIASGSNDNTARIWEPRSGKSLRALKGDKNHFLSIAFSPDGARIVSGSYDNTVKIWDLRSGKSLRSLQGHQSSVYSVAFNPDGTCIASGSRDKTVRIWDPHSGKSLHSLGGHRDVVNSVVFSPDGTRIASGSKDDTIKIWNPHSGELLYSFAGHQFSRINNVAFSPDGASIASGYHHNTTVTIWDPLSGELLRSLEGHQSSVNSVVFSPDGASIASGSDDNTVRIWDPHSGKFLDSLEGHQSSVFSVAFSPDGTRIASGSYDNTVRIWEVATGACLAILYGAPEGWVAYTPEGRYKYGGDIAGHFWHVAGLRRFEPGELDDYVPGLRLSQDEPLY
ncbi:MAG: NACHT domain-containing protein [Gammaproteobacteria bacterium]|nr:NACHT domain-containing protein [Gammaproteobacteria bacterium]